MMVLVVLRGLRTSTPRLSEVLVTIKHINAMSLDYLFVFGVIITGLDGLNGSMEKTW